MSSLLSIPLITIIFLSYGVNPILAYQKMFYGAFGSAYSISETLTKSIPLMLCSLGLTITYKTAIWNIGAEGQLLMGAIFSSGIALSFSNWPAYLLLPTMFVFGFVGGAIWSLIPAILKIKFQTNEVISTLMMNYIAMKILEYLVYGPWRGKEEWGFPFTEKFSSSAQLPTIGATRIHYPTLIIAIVAAVGIYVLINRTKLGFEIRTLSKNPEAAKYVGINYAKIVLLIMIISGGLAGLAGVGEVAGIQHRLKPNISHGYGFTAIIVAWLGRLHPLSTILVSILYSGLLVGGEMLQIVFGLPIGIIEIFNGVILFSMLSGDFFLRNKISFEISSKAER
ncbi:ABC transporter permease [Candidatus Bathyarchaeota archaeon]|nr:ABC transporter permease [Candidatus Bathyarchaeota archaeon]